MSLTDREVEGLLRSLFPEKTFDWLEAEEGDGGIGDLLLALAEELNADAFELIDQLMKEVNPATAEQSLPEREASMGLDASRVALYGDTASRQAQLIARWRERGTPTIDRVYAALVAVCGPTSVTILEHTRAQVSAVNWRDIAGLPLAIPSSADLDIPFTCGDNAPASRAGAQVTVRITHPSVEDLTLKIIAPDATESASMTFGSGAVVERDFRFFWPGAAGKTIDGTWTVRITDNGASGGTVEDPAADGVSGLLVEGIGRAANGADGLAAIIFEWSAVIDESVGSSTYDRASVLAIVKRWNPAHERGGVALYQTDGVLGALGDDPNCIADLCVCS